MRRIYRVLRKAFAGNPLDGEGAYRYGGRWSSLGIRLSYASEHQSLAMLEYFVHLDKDEPPDDLVLASADVPGNVETEIIDRKLLPDNWRDDAAPAHLARFGDQFAKRGERCLLWIPSVLAPNESNCLLNPAHPDFARILIRAIEPLTYDSRLFRISRQKR